MTRPKPIPEPSTAIRTRRPDLAPEANRSNVRTDELDAQLAWLAHIAAGRIIVR